MTEAEWLACSEPGPMLEFLQAGIIALVDNLPSEMERQAMRRFIERGAISRKLALFACACCRNVWQAVTDERSHTAIELSEQFIDGLTSKEQMYRADYAAHEARDAIQHKRGTDGTETHIRRIAADACWETASAMTSLGRSFRLSVAGVAQECAEVATWIGVSPSFGDARAKQAEFLHCLVGNPFKLPMADSVWLTPTVVYLAQSIYENRESEGYPPLADALKEAGCNNADILNHCRQAGVHVRGCWVVDLLLGKE